ncbi:HBL/NHE enterotoxin family protein [Cytobacillus sp. Hm23]
MIRKFFSLLLVTLVLLNTGIINHSYAAENDSDTTVVTNAENDISIDPVQIQDNVNNLSHMIQQVEEYALAIKEKTIEDELGSSSNFADHQLTSKEHADTWLYDINNQMYKVVSDVVDYSNDFEQAYTQAKVLISELNDNADSSGQLLSLLLEMKGKVAEKLATIDEVQPKLKDFDADLTNDVTNFTDDKNEVESEISHKQNEIKALQAEIDDLNKKMKEKTPVTTCNYYGCTVTYVQKYDNTQLQKDITSNQNDIDKLNEEINTLSNFQNEIQSLIDKINTVANNLTLTNIRDAWVVLDYSFEQLINVLNKTDVDNHPALLNPQMDIANSRWKDIKEVALTLQESMVFNEPYNKFTPQSIDHFRNVLVNPNEYTIEAVVTPYELTDFERIFQAHNENNGKKTTIFFNSNGRISFEAVGNSYDRINSSDGVAQVGHQIYVAMTYSVNGDGQHVTKAFVNGEKIGETVSSSLSYIDDVMYIGSTDGKTNVFNGAFTNLRFSNIARTENDIKLDYEQGVSKDINTIVYMDSDNTLEITYNEHHQTDTDSTIDISKSPKAVSYYYVDAVKFVFTTKENKDLSGVSISYRLNNDTVINERMQQMSDGTWIYYVPIKDGDRIKYSFSYGLNENGLQYNEHTDQYIYTVPFNSYPTA